jgi:chromosomal replication initiation ATPase DnaA
VPADVTRYVLSRIERSFEGVARTVDALDKAALSQQRPVSIPLAREVFIDLDFDDR